MRGGDNQVDWHPDTNGCMSPVYASQEMKSAVKRLPAKTFSAPQVKEGRYCHQRMKYITDHSKIHCWECVKCSVPHYQEGYTTDDNARGLSGGRIQGALTNSVQWYMLTGFRRAPLSCVL
jgi:hypothetical protein